MRQQRRVFQPPVETALLLLVLGRHARGKERGKRHPVAGLDSGLEFSGRRIATRCLNDGPWKNVFPRSLDQPAFAGSKISGSTALRMSGRDLILGSVGLFRQRIPIGKPIGSRHTAWAIV